MRAYRSSLALALAIAVSAVAASPSAAQHAHGRRRTAATTVKPPNAGEPFCRSKARDYAYEKHADPGQERMAFERCMGR